VRITDIEFVMVKGETLTPPTMFGPWVEPSEAGSIRYSLIRVLTDEGIEGDYIVWSEIPSARPNSLKETLNILKPYLIGRDPLDRESIWQELGSFWYGLRGPAMAAIDMALWDIAGKAVGMPVYRLLGAYRHKVRAYASEINYAYYPSTSLDEYMETLLKIIEKGYKAIKVKPRGTSLDEGLKVAKLARDTLGDDITLMYDAVFAYNRHEALKIGRLLEKLNYYWYEGPIPISDIEGYVELARELDIPITVELLGNYLEYITRGAVDILRPIAGFTGGITEMKKTAILAEFFGLMWEPHSFGGAFIQAANLHVILSVKNCTFLEMPLKDGKEGIFDLGVKKSIEPDKDGFVHAPENPGLGVEIDWSEVEIPR